MPPTVFEKKLDVSGGGVIFAGRDGGVEEFETVGMILLFLDCTGVLNAASKGFLETEAEGIDEEVPVAGATGVVEANAASKGFELGIILFYCGTAAAATGDLNPALV